MSKILIENAVVYDGSGCEPYKASILIENDRIMEVDRACSIHDADQKIDARGMAVSPGFIDIHRHCDVKPFNNGSFGDVMLAQGITTTVVGNCGISMTPVSMDEDLARETYNFDEPVLGPAYPSIRTYHDYMASLEKMDLPLNMAAMIGTGNVKIAVKGFSDKPFSDEEMEEAKALIADALALGSPGISAGIMYLPECYSSMDEFARLLEPLGKAGGVLTTHIRGEGDSMVESVKEVIGIASKVGCALEISHFKSCGMKNWRKDIHAAIALIEEARKKGQDVTCDFYPYEGGSTALTTMLPPVFVNGNLGDALKRLGTQEGVDDFREKASVEYPDWDNFCITLGWDRILISGVVKEENRKFLGMDMVSAAKKYGYEDAFALAAYLMHGEDGKTAIINMSMCQDDIDAVAKLPYSIIISDSIYAETDTPHPRLYGAFPKVIREYVMERGLYTMQEAVRKMTALPAWRMGIKERGMIRPGYYADINIFNPAVFRDNATFQDPAKVATGLSFCLINGEVVFKDGKVLSRSAGRVVRREN